MLDTLIAAAVAAAVYGSPVMPPHVFTNAATVSTVRSLSAVRRAEGYQPSSSRDSLKNGAITGAIAGGLAGALLAAVGCGLSSPLGDTGESDCVRGTMILVGMGAGIGAAIGVGVDALFEQGPSPSLPLGGKRVGVRVRVAF